jgi:uncharacterized membrane protein
LVQHLRRYLVTGLILWVPIGITIWVLTLIVSTLDKTLLLIPEQYRPETVLGFAIPGLGVLLTLVVLLITGIAARNFIGQQLIKGWDRILRRIPVVKSIYSGVKQVSDTLFSDSGLAFRKALLIEFPHQGSYTIAFMTGTPSGELVTRLPGEHVSVYVPTTPNPTSGYFLLLPKSRTQELDMSVDDALKYIVSMGVVGPAVAPKAAALLEPLPRPSIRN